MDGLFITGIDTGVGKTAISAGLLKLFHGTRKVCYWKPVQTGTIVADDTSDVKEMTGLSEDCFLAPSYRFAEPLSPYMAAKKWDKKIELDAMEKVFREKAKAGYFMIVEGAGGILVPLNEHALQIDLIERLKIPSIFVAEDRVGAINQTLLTLNAARDRKIPILGVIITKSRGNLGNAESISHFGKVKILLELPPTEDVRNTVAQVGGDDNLRQMFKVPALP